MKAKLIAASAALALVLGTSAPALAVDCNTSIDGIQTPGGYISSAYRSILKPMSPFSALAAAMSVSVGVSDQPGIGRDLQTVLVECGIGSKSDPSSTSPPASSSATPPAPPLP